MTEQPVETMAFPPVETEQQFLGNHPAVLAPGAHPEPPVAVLTNTDATSLHLQAEVHAGQALFQLQNGYLDAGIAWLQSALAFALNGREAVRTGGNR